jgi:outer membrane biosynthesis protein TonB
MVRTDLMPKQRKEPHLARNAGALAVSCIFHAAFFGLLLWVTLVYRAKWMPSPSRSQARAPSITLMTLVVTPSPMPALPPKPETPVVATMPAEMIQKAPQPRPAPVEDGVPVLVQQSRTVPVTQTKSPPTPPASMPATRVAKASPAKAKPAASASFASSYAPGKNVLPHPPYPEDAQNMGETGTVVMSVTFNMAGDVTQAKVSQSSGVRVLDTCTCSFILTHWHSTALAGETVMQPVCYTGE